MSFRTRVHSIVRAVPRGRVVTYGQVAALAGKPRAAREVGWIAAGGGADTPWQRVVNRSGGLASGYTGGRAGHARALRRDGVKVSPQLTVDLSRYQWWPAAHGMRKLGIPVEAVARSRTVTRTPRTRRGSVQRISRTGAARRRSRTR